MRITDTLRALLVPAVALGASLCYAQPADTPDPPDPARAGWSPPSIEPGAYDDITAYNIFSPDRHALATEAQRVPEPDEPEDPGPPEPVIDIPPPDPDASLVLVGISVRGASPTAFIEDAKNGVVITVAEPGPFSEGEVQAITPDGIVYRVGEDERAIRIGRTLTGESPLAPSSTGGDSEPADDTATDGPATAPGDDGMTELERRMRERRNSE